MPMLRAAAVCSTALGGPVVDVITLDYRARRRRRVLLTTDSGRELMLDLAHTTHIADGDGLALAGGGHVLVRAAPEDLLEIRAADASALARLAWHLGNRHTPAEIAAEAIYIEADHVLEEMLIGLGASVRRLSRPFEPGGGAYAGHHGHAEAADHDQ
jgi:urease accessory protein